MAITLRLAIEDGAGIVAPLLDVGRERSAPQGRAHLLGNGMHRALKDRQLYRICRLIGSCVSPLHRDDEISESHPPCAEQPGGNTVAEVYSVIIAGPWIASPGVRPSRR